MSYHVENVVPLMHVFDMQRSVRFYRDVLGFEVISASGPGEDYYWAMLKCGEARIMLNAMYEADERPAKPDPVRGVGHQDVVLYFGCDDVDEVWRRLGSKGLSVGEPIVTHYAMKQLYARDPDGFAICFQQPITVE